MNKWIKTLALLAITSWSTAAQADFISGSSGSLGAFNPTSNTVVTLPLDGVLNYTTITIPAGVTVTFQKNSSNTPVYMLATDDVNIAGAIDVSGASAASNAPGMGGPGGFSGGYMGGYSFPAGKGLGSGGGTPNFNWCENSSGGGYGSNGAGPYPGTTYGNMRLFPLIGGSGGSGSTICDKGNGSGGGGGGAISIASSTSIILTGTIISYGGNGSNTGGYYGRAGGGGSGGGIKLVANTISGNGAIVARGGTSNDYGGMGGAGRIRLEAAINNRTALTDPPYSFGAPSSIFPANPPSLTLAMIGGVQPPATPTGNYNQPDITLPSTTVNPVAVTVAATNIPDGTTVAVLSIPQYGAATSVNTTLSGGTASANINLSSTYSNIVVAQATFTVVAMFYGGEEIDKVRVAATLGGSSETTYITKAGKEIKGVLLAAMTR